MIFSNVSAIKRAIEQYGILEHMKVKLFKNDKKKIKARCVSGCPWMLYVGVEVDNFSFEIRTLNLEHTCDLDFSSDKIKSKWLGKRYLHLFRADPNWSLSSFQQLVVSDLKIDVTRYHYYKAKEYALSILNGSLMEQ